MDGVNLTLKKMKKLILNQIKIIEIICVVMVVWFISYNWYFGWNIHPQSENEKICETIFQAIFGLAIGFFIRAAINTMKLICNKL